MIGGFFEHPVFTEGYIGVGFFFMLSGFIIAHSNYGKLEKGEISKSQFWIARIARIYPLHLLTLLIMALAGGWIATGVVDWLLHFSANLLLIQAFIPAHDFYFSFNGPSWSLSCELFFYLLFPLISLPLFKNPRRLFILTLSFLIAVPFIMTFTNPEYNRFIWYVNPLVRLADFIVGMFLYYLYSALKNIRWSYKIATLYESCAVILFVLFYMAAINNWIPQVYRYSCFYWLPVSLLLFVFAQQKGFLSGLLSNRMLIQLGKVSFGIYLIHFIALKAYLRLVEYSGILLPEIWGAIIVFLITIGLSLLSYYNFENPLNRYIRKRFG